MKYLPRHLTYVRRAYKLVPLEKVRKGFNRYFGTDLTQSQIRGITRNHKMKSGRTGHFQKGNIPWSNGTKGVLTGSATSFKKGNRPHNWVPVGTERYTTKDHYIKVKVAEPNKWEFKHLLVWKQNYGPIPDGKVIVFKDGDRDNCSPENLQAIDRGVLAQYNKMQGGNLPPELRTAVRTVAAIKVGARRLVKNSETTNQQRGEA